MMAKLDKILVIGAGMTGSITSAALKSEGLQVVIWEKARGAGGRMSTSRSPSDQRCTADLGAQYITATENDYKRHQSYYDELTSAHVLKPLQATIEGDSPREHGSTNFVTPSGISSAVKHFLNKSGATINFERRLTDLSLKNRKWEASSEDGNIESFDGVIITVPVPQLLQLTGSIKDTIESQPDVKQKLDKVVYSSRYAIALYYNLGTALTYPWGAKYFDDKCIRFVSVDHKKRGAESSEISPSVVAHTTAKFGIDNLEADMDSVCSNIVLPRLRTLLPDLPVPQHVKNLRWRYSQVYKPYEDTPGAVLLNDSPPLICAGDAFSRSRFDGCIDSAEKAVQLLGNCTQSVNNSG